MRVVEAVRRLDPALEGKQDTRLAIRVGIHTGLVVIGRVGAGGRHEYLALGETPNIAARLQNLADPDTVLISATTNRLTRGYFDTRELGRHVLKGVAQPRASSRHSTRAAPELAWTRLGPRL